MTDSPLPSRMAHILEGESLLNDATGLVCFSFAVVAALTGTFSLASAAGQFVLVAFGGILIGLLVAWAIGWLNQLLVSVLGRTCNSNYDQLTDAIYGLFIS